MRSRIRTGLGAAALVVAMAAAGLASASAAHAAPGDQVSAIFDTGNFGPVKTGTTERRTFTLTNNGVDPITIDPAPVTTITAPFAAVTTTIVAGGTIDPGATRVVVVDYTAGAAGTTPGQIVYFKAVSVNDTMITQNIPLPLAGESTATDPASFEVTDPTGGPVDFGGVTVGSSMTRTIVITNNGVVDLKFESSAITILGADGNPIPVTLVGAPFVKEVVPGASATIEISFTPTAMIQTSGVVVIQGRQYSGDTVVATATRELELVGVGIAPVVPTATPTPSATAVAGGTGGRQLASTGAEGIGGFVGGTVAVMIVLAGIAVVVERRIRSRA